MVDHCGNTCIKLPLLPTEVLPAVLYIGSSELPELLDEPPELLDEPPELPEELIGQLKVGGRMVVPVGSFFQELYLITRTDSGYDRKALFPVRFVPMVHGEDR